MKSVFNRIGLDGLFFIILIAGGIVTMTLFPQKMIERAKKKFQTSDRVYEIIQYSGGLEVARYNFTGTLNDAEGSDGYYFYKGDTLIEISGDIIITSIDK